MKTERTGVVRGTSRTIVYRILSVEGNINTLTPPIRAQGSMQKEWVSQRWTRRATAYASSQLLCLHAQNFLKPKMAQILAWRR